MHVTCLLMHMVFVQSRLVIVLATQRFQTVMAL